MSSFMGAPIMNSGYYDVPINNQYSNNNFPRNNTIKESAYNINSSLNQTINNNKGNYVIYQEPNRPSSLYLESDVDNSGYYQDPMSLSSDAKMPLVKKKEQLYDYGNNYQNNQYIESFDNNSIELVGRGTSLGSGSGYTLGPGRNIPNNYLNPQTIPNISRNYWNDNDPGYSNYYFVAPPVQIVANINPEYLGEFNRNIPQQPNYQQSRHEQPRYQQPRHEQPRHEQPRHEQPNYQQPHQRRINQPMLANEVKIESIKDDVKMIIQESKKIKEKKDKGKKKKDKKNKEIDRKVLWNIIIILAILVFLFLCKTIYDYKIITFKW